MADLVLCSADGRTELADRISAGRGNDVINVATAGPRASVGCGTGYDKVRANRNEKRRLHRCERVYLVR